MELLYERVVVPVGGTPADERALALVPRIVSPRSVVVTLLYVVEVAQSMPLDAELPAEVARGDVALSQAEATARKALGNKGVTIQTELLQARSVGAAIVDEAAELDADAIVMTVAIRRKHGRPTFGETVDYVLLNAPCEVVLMRLAQSEPTNPLRVGR
jgi:nucleotide-binding universal stress UspA family protein